MWPILIPLSYSLLVICTGTFNLTSQNWVYKKNTQRKFHLHFLYFLSFFFFFKFLCYEWINLAIEKTKTWWWNEWIYAISGPKSVHSTFGHSCSQFIWNTHNLESIFVRSAFVAYTPQLVASLSSSITLFVSCSPCVCLSLWHEQKAYLKYIISGHAENTMHSLWNYLVHRLKIYSICVGEGFHWRQS